MSFPDLDPLPDDRNNDKPSTIWARATGVPTNGNNVIGLPFVDQGDSSVPDHRGLAEVQGRPAHRTLDRRGLRGQREPGSRQAFDRPELRAGWS